MVSHFSQSLAQSLRLVSSDKAYRASLRLDQDIVEKSFSHILERLHVVVSIVLRWFVSRGSSVVHLHLFEEVELVRSVHQQS